MGVDAPVGGYDGVAKPARISLRASDSMSTYTADMGLATAFPSESPCWLRLGTAEAKKCKAVGTWAVVGV